MSTEQDWFRIVARTCMRYGLMAGALGLVAIAAFFYIGKHPFWIFPLFDVRIILMLIFLIIALREVREYHFGGLLFFWQAMTGSLLFVMVTACTGYLGVWLFGTIDADFLGVYVQQGQEQIARLSPDDIKELGPPAVEELKRTLPLTTLGWMAKRYAIQTIFMGFFISIVISVVLRRQTSVQ